MRCGLGHGAPLAFALRRAGNLGSGPDRQEQRPKAKPASGHGGKVLRLTHRERPPDGSTHWSTRALATRLGIGKDTVATICADHNL